MTPVIEAILFVSGAPVDISELAAALEITELEMEGQLESLERFYKENQRGIQLARINDKVQLKTNEAYSTHINRIFQPPQKYNMSQSILETLSIIAYRQPVTRSEIEAVRGVKADYSVSALLERRLIQPVGRKDTLGRPMMYGTTEDFLRHFGLSSLEELPPLEEFGGMAEIESLDV